MAVGRFVHAVAVEVEIASVAVQHEDERRVVGHSFGQIEAVGAFQSVDRAGLDGHPGGSRRGGSEGRKGIRQHQQNADRKNTFHFGWV